MKDCLSRPFVSCLFVAAILCISNSANAQSTADTSPKSIAAILQPFVDSHTLAGAVTLVASKDKVLSLEAVGWADMAAGRPMRTDCVFWIASQSKPITAAALMILVDEHVKRHLRAGLSPLTDRRLPAASRSPLDGESSAR